MLDFKRRLAKLQIGGNTMTFGEKLKEARKSAGLTQTELGEASGISLRTICLYENGKMYPRKRENYQKLADALQVDVQYLMGENESFVVKATEEYGGQGAKQAEKLISDMSALYAGGDLSDEDKDAVMKALQEIYWQSKARNVEKYTPKKYQEPV